MRTMVCFFSRAASWLISLPGLEPTTFMTCPRDKRLSILLVVIISRRFLSGIASKILPPTNNPRNSYSSNSSKAVAPSAGLGGSGATAVPPRTRQQLLLATTSALPRTAWSCRFRVSCPRPSPDLWTGIRLMMGKEKRMEAAAKEMGSIFRKMEVE